MLGDASKCWTLTATATRVMVALGYHNVAETLPQTEVDEEIHGCVAWCYQLDKAMSMLLLRPQTLPKLRISARELIHADSSAPMTRFIKLMLEMAQIQEAVLDLPTGPVARDEKLLIIGINAVRQSMTECESRIQQVPEKRH